MTQVPMIQRWWSPKSIYRLNHLHPHSKCIDDAIECTYTGHDDTILHLGYIRLGGVDASCQLGLRHFCLLACIEQYLTGIEGEGILFGLDALRSPFLAEFLVKNEVVVNDLMIVCLP